MKTNSKKIPDSQMVQAYGQRAQEARGKNHEKERNTVQQILISPVIILLLTPTNQLKESI